MFIRKLEAEKNKRFSQPLLMIKSLERRQLKVRVLLFVSKGLFIKLFYKFNIVVSVVFNH